MDSKNTSNIENKLLQRDQKYFGENKLKGYIQKPFRCIEVGDHLRYTSNVYKQPDKRKCVYAIVLEKNDEKEELLVRAFKSDYDPWKIVVRPLHHRNNFKQVILYVHHRRYNYYKGRERKKEENCKKASDKYLKKTIFNKE